MASDTSVIRVGFVGAGRMATALARGLIAAKFSAPQEVIASDVSKEARGRFERETGVRTVDQNAVVCAESDVVFLAVKPQQMREVLAEIKGHVCERHLVISIAAGVPLSVLTRELGSERRIVRVMPNTPALVGAGASAFAMGPGTLPTDAALMQQILETVGIAVEVPERLLDAVTGLSGSGPAFVYQFIEALSDGGVRVGLPRDVATRLAAQTVLGAARMVLETGQHPGVLKDAVTSPGGTTIAGLHALEVGALRGCVMNAVRAATERSIELGRSS